MQIFCGVVILVNGLKKILKPASAQFFMMVTGKLQKKVQYFQILVALVL
jgi:hypothetical protein